MNLTNLIKIDIKLGLSRKSFKSKLHLINNNKINFILNTNVVSFHIYLFKQILGNQKFFPNINK